MYRVFLTESAQDANSRAESHVEQEGQILTFRSKQAVEDLVDDWSTDGTRLRVQQAAPNDPREVNAYIVPNPVRHTSKPKKSNKEGLVFDTTANQYGELGEAVVAGSYGISPGLKYYIKQNIDLPPGDEYKITKRSSSRISDSIEYDGSWTPDLIIDIKRIENWETYETLYCEIKSGNASFERRQKEAMQSLAKDYKVLKIRVDITELPSEYRLLIESVS